jgi:hypothetical protein
MARDLSIQDIDILYTHSIAGAHNRGNIVRVMHILHYHSQPCLAAVKHLLQFVIPFRSHSAIKNEKEKPNVRKIDSAGCPKNRPFKIIAVRENKSYQIDIIPM